MLLSHHLISGPQFSSQPNNSKPPFFGIGGDGPGGEGGVGGAGGGVGVGGLGGTGLGLGGGGVGAGAGGMFAQSPFDVHFVFPSTLQIPPLPPVGYPPQVDLSPHLLQQQFEAASVGLTNRQPSKSLLAMWTKQ